MYNGHGAAYFAIYLASAPSTPEKEIYLHSMVVNRKSNTLLNRDVQEFTNPFTKKIYERSGGFRIDDEITVVSNNFTGSVQDYATLEGTESTQTEFYKAIELLKYANNSAYYIMYSEKNDARLPTLDLPSKEVLIECSAFSDEGSIQQLGSWTTTSVNDYISNLSYVTLRIRSLDLTTEPFLPSPPIPPVLVSPVTDSYSTFTVTFEWETVGSYDTYKIQIAYSETVPADPVALFKGGSLIYTDTVAALTKTYTSDTNFDHVYIYWRVCASPGGSYSAPWFIKPFEFKNCLRLGWTSPNWVTTKEQTIALWNYTTHAFDTASEFGNTTGKIQMGGFFYIPPLNAALRAVTTQFLITAVIGTSSSVGIAISLNYQAAGGGLLEGWNIRTRISSPDGTKSIGRLTTTTPASEPTIRSGAGLGEWHFIAAVYDLDLSGAERVKLIYDGNEVGEYYDTGSFTTPNTANKIVQISGYWTTSARFFGCVDHCFASGIGGTHLTLDQVKAMWHGGLGMRFPVTPQVILKFDETTGAEPINSGSGLAHNRFAQGKYAAGSEPTTPADIIPHSTY
jgi:hypothetical protein